MQLGTFFVQLFVICAWTCTTLGPKSQVTANADKDFDSDFQVETPLEDSCTRFPVDSMSDLSFKLSNDLHFFFFLRFVFSVPVKENILLASWEPFPVDQWDFAVLNVTEQFVSESGRIPITQFTKENFPDVSLVFTCNRGDNAYFPNELEVPIIGVDTFQNEFYFQQYLSLIYTIHGFRNPTELWAHFFTYQDAFAPVRQRVSAAFQEYVENYHTDPQYNEEVVRPYPEDRRRM